jgi:thiol:disulfide interchange protein
MIETLQDKRGGVTDTDADTDTGVNAGRSSANRLLRRILVALIAAGVFAGWKYLGPKNALAQAGWIYDWDAAVAQSKQTGKPALVLFTADWCPPCKTFKSQVLADKEVQGYLRENYTLVVVDVTDRTGANARRASEFNVRGIPALILYNESGQEVARGGGMPADALLAWLRSNGAALRSR